MAPEGGHKWYLHTAFGHSKPQARFCVAAPDQTARTFFIIIGHGEQSAGEIIRAPSHAARTDVDGKVYFDPAGQEEL